MDLALKQVPCPCSPASPLGTEFRPGWFTSCSPGVPRAIPTSLHPRVFFYTFRAQITGEAVSRLGPIFQCPSDSVSGVLILVLTGISPGFITCYESVNTSLAEEVGKAVIERKPHLVNMSFVLLYFRDRISQCSPRWPWATVWLRTTWTPDSLASASWGLGIPGLPTMPSFQTISAVPSGTASKTLTYDFSICLFKHIQLNQPAKH